MAVALRGGVERGRRLEGEGPARVEGPDRAQRVAQEPVDQRHPLLGNVDAGNPDAGADLVDGDVVGLIWHGESPPWRGWQDATDSHRPAQGASLPPAPSPCPLPLRGRGRARLALRGEGSGK